MMAKLTELKKIRELISKASSPLYLYDDDPDGLCSFLLLKRKFKKGEGLPVKTAPSLKADFIGNIQKHSYDIVVILDKPIVEQELIDRIKRPVVYLDHHPIQNLKGVYYYNPRLKNKKDNSPTTKICYDIVKQDEWIAGIGIIADWFIPSFINKLIKKYPDLIKKTRNPPEIMFNQRFGMLIRMLGFILKGDNRWIKECMPMLEKAKNPYEILNDKEGTIMERFQEVEKAYEILLENALKEPADEKLLVISYPSGKYSLTGELANELFYRNPGKLVIVAREKDNEMRFSLRGNNALKILKKSMKKINGYGGGHENACGGAVAKEDFTKFLEKIRKSLK